MVLINAVQKGIHSAKYTTRRRVQYNTVCSSRIQCNSTLYSAVPVLYRPSMERLCQVKRQEKYLKKREQHLSLMMALRYICTENIFHILLSLKGGVFDLDVPLGKAFRILKVRIRSPKSPNTEKVCS